jgi:8-hydroxy-5-deazaflavin:NADPH oxidoreductase
MRVAIVGGTGAFGQALARRLREAGEDVVVGSRDLTKALDAAQALDVEGAANADAVRGADLVVLATKADAAITTARELRDAIGDTPVLSVASELRVHGDRSLAERIADELQAPVAAGLHTVAARTVGGEQDALVCGDDERAKMLALELASRAIAGRAIDAGPLASARTLEGLTGVIVNVNRRYRAHAGVRLTGLP